MDAPVELNHAAEAVPLASVRHGKVRDTYAVGSDRLLMVASDRISAFDVILPGRIPGKGRVLTQLSAFWFDQMRPLVPNHLLSIHWPTIAAATGLDEQVADLDGRSSLVRRAKRIDVECVVRGYLAGSGWGEYRAHGSLAGVLLPPGLSEGTELPAPAFTPAMKNDTGHDENIDFKHLAVAVGMDMASRLQQLSVAVYNQARQYAWQRGIIVADTKFEFGLIDDELILIDELLTPDSSRFWPRDTYRPGRGQSSLDKQPVRDYLLACGWNQQAPGPVLPPEVVAATEARYRTAYAALTGRSIDGGS